MTAQQSAPDVKERDQMKAKSNGAPKAGQNQRVLSPQSQGQGQRVPRHNTIIIVTKRVCYSWVLVIPREGAIGDEMV